MSGLWQRLRGQWFRLFLLVLSLGLLAAAVSVVFHPQPASAKPTPLPVGAEEYEIAWLYPATNTSTWERFVAAMRSASERLKQQNDQIEFDVGAAAFPLQATAVPEMAIRWRDSGRRLVFRWYKLSSSSKTRDWVEALAQRSPPPLAIIGGGNSYSGLELARQLRRVCPALPEAIRPLLLMTTATADRAGTNSNAEPELADVEVNQIYAERTFRFCFTNRQMAIATTRFIWQRDELRPEGDPIFQVAWEDDSYSRDLLMGYHDALLPVQAAALTREWLWLSGCVGLGTLPLGGGNLPGVQVRPLTAQQNIYSSVGTYHAANQFESSAVRFMLEDLAPLPKQRRMLIVAGQFQPSRRFLQALARTAPDEPRRLVVVAGDTVGFNNIYRDRLAAWRTQELPFRLVFFCHRNPVDAAAGFDPAHGEVTGTEDVLLFRDIVETCAIAFANVEAFQTDAAHFAQLFREVRVSEGRLSFDPEGQPLFHPDGRRRGGTGEHVVYLRPNRKGEQVLPEATVEVWTRDASPGMPASWRLVDSLNVPDPQTDLDRVLQP